MATSNSVNNKPVITGTANQITVVNAADNSTSTISTASTQLSTTQPMFVSIFTTTNSTATGDGTAYTIPFDTAVNNQGSNYNTSTGIFTAPVTGVYLFVTGVLTQAGAINTSIELDLTLNTGRWLLAYSTISVPATATIMYKGSAIIPMSSADTAKIVFTASGAAKTTAVVGTASANPDTYFCGFLLH